MILDRSGQRPLVVLVEREELYRERGLLRILLCGFVFLFEPAHEEAECETSDEEQGADHPDRGGCLAVIGGGDDGGRCDYDAEDDMEHAGVGFFEDFFHQLREKQDADQGAESDRNDDAEVHVADAGVHVLVHLEVDEEVRRAHAGDDDAEGEYGARHDPGRKVLGYGDGQIVARSPESDKGEDSGDGGDRDMARFAALFSRFFIKRRKGSKDASDKAPENLELVVCHKEGEGLCGEKEAQEAADSDGDEEQNVLQEVLADIGEKADDSLVQAKYGGECTSADAGQDGARADQCAFYDPERPVYGVYLDLFLFFAHIYTCFFLVIDSEAIIP